MPIALTFIRFMLASVLLAVFLWRKNMFRRKYFKRPSRYFLLGGSFSFYFIFMFEALKTASPISTSSIFTLMPFLAVCLDRAFFGLKTKANIVFYLLIHIKEQCNPGKSFASPLENMSYYHVVMLNIKYKFYIQ